MKKHKKGQVLGNINALIFGAILFVVAIVVVTIGAQITTTVKDSIDRGSAATVNESGLTWGNNTNMTLNFNEVSISAVFNCSGSEETTIGSDNYTVFSAKGIIQCDSNSTDFPHDTDPICVNYTYVTDTAAYNVSVKGEEGIITFSDYFGVIATIIILVIIVGLLIGVIALFTRSR